MIRHVLDSTLGKDDGDPIRGQLETLCAAYLASDEWGRQRTMETALRHGGSPKEQSPSTLRLVTSAALDQ
jgi:hypothetical protein